MFLAAAFYWAFAYDDAYAFWVIPPVIALASLYVLEPQLNWWIWKRYPPDLKPGFRQLLEQHSGYYQRLDDGAKREFRRRVFLFTQGSDFMPQAFEEVPEDIKVMIAVGAVQLTLGREDFLFPKFETIIVYPHPFPSPQYPEHWHGSELYEPDGALLFSAEHLTRAFIQERLYLNLALYEYARAFRLVYAYPPPPDAAVYPWEALERASGFSQEAVSRWIGLDEIDAFGVAAALFFSMPDAFARELPEAYAAFRAYFGQDPQQPPRSLSA
jgi:hypothetical protein